jgi:CHASE2 domain-containing sensor protein
MARLFGPLAFSPAALWFAFWGLVAAIISIHHRDFADVALILAFLSVCFCVLAFFCELEMDKKQK